MIIREERLSDKLIEELVPLTELSFVESKMLPDQKYKPDWERYLYLDEIEILRSFMARNDKHELVGYISFVLDHEIHTHDYVQAMHDSFFILKQHRAKGLALKMLNYAIDKFKTESIHRVTMSVLPQVDYSRLLLGIGFEQSEVFYTKRIN